MKIGILTFHAALNSGAVLQAYALQTYLSRQGYDVEVINYRRKKRFDFKAYIAKSPRRVWGKWKDRWNGIRYELRGDFGKILQRGEKVYWSLEELQNDPPAYDVYIAGSDQIWNVYSESNINPVYFLQFGTDDIKRIAYAASMGQVRVPDSLRSTIKNLLQKFDVISLREKKAADFVQSLFGTEREIFQAPDPTLLLSAVDYVPLLETRVTAKKPYIASYMLAELGGEQKQSVQYVHKAKGLKILNLRNPDTCIRLEDAENIIVTPTEWLSYMYHAEFTICCSFHAVVFSLIFHKSFVVITPRDNERIESLLRPLNLMGRVFKEFDLVKLRQALGEHIIWTEVDELIHAERTKGAEFLSKSLKH